MPKAQKLETICVIPDFHSHPSYENSRAKSLGCFISDRKPDHIVCLGDFADMSSLSTYDRGKLSFEGRRYADDTDAARDAMNCLMHPIRLKHNYVPRLHFVLGNHEDRIRRAVEDNPILQGKLSVKDLGYEDFGWKVYPFLQPVVIGGIYFAHYFVSGIKGQAISGESPAKQLCLKLHRSAVAGHSHTFDHSERVSIDGTRMFGLVAGCFVHPDFSEPWATASKEYWWRGVVLLKDIDGKGYYDAIEAVTMRKILRDFS